MKRLIYSLGILLMVVSCKSSKSNCDAYSIKGYDYIQIVGYTDTIPTFGERELHLPPGEYLIKGWKGKNITYNTVRL